MRLRIVLCWVLALLITGSCLSGCTTMNAAKYDPCAPKARRGSQRSGPVVVACYTLGIRFRLTVLDADTKTPIAAAAALRGQNVIDEPMSDGGVLDWADQDGVIDTVAETFVGTANPYTDCFRQSFPGISIEIQQDGYESHPCRVRLPEVKGQVVDLGVVYLRRTNSESPREPIACMFTPVVVPIQLRVLGEWTRLPLPSAEVMARASASEDNGIVLGWSGEDGRLNTVLKIHPRYDEPTAETTRRMQPDIVLEVNQDGFNPHRIPLQLPQAEGMPVDLGDVYLAPKESTS